MQTHKTEWNYSLFKFQGSNPRELKGHLHFIKEFSITSMIHVTTKLKLECSLSAIIFDEYISSHTQILRSYLENK